MSPRARPAAALELDTGQGVRDRLVLAGPSLHGWVYRSATGQGWYRLLAIPDEQATDARPAADCAPLARRHDIQGWVGPPPPGAARIVAAQQSGDGQFFWVHYQIEAARSLQDALAEADPFVRLHYGLLALRALPGWWARLHPGVLPLPADVVFTADDTPHLLALPPGALPDVASVFAEPARALYLAPELVRGLPAGPDNLDRYALGVALLQCFGRPLPGDPAGQLARTANGTALAPQRFEDDLPSWLARVHAAAEARAAVRRLLDPDPLRRSTVEPEALARQLEEHCRQMAPEPAVRWLLHQGQNKEAFDLLQDILLEQTSSELLLLAAEIAGPFLRRDFEAIDLYDRAIEHDPHRPEAYTGQFRTILAVRERIACFPPEEKAALGAQLDAKLRRAFEHMSPEEQFLHEEDMARELLRGGNCDEAADFIHQRIVVNDEYQWHRFDLTTLYVEVLRDQGRVAEERQELDRVKDWLRYSADSKVLPPGDVEYYALRLAALEFDLRRREAADGVAPGPGGGT
jgi:hypothetical protein